MSWLDRLKPSGDHFVDNNHGVSWDSRTEYLALEVLGFCGCGDPAQVMAEHVLPFLKRLEVEDFGSYEDLAYMFLVYWANDKGFAEHGTTARCSWLTEKGRELLGDIQTAMRLEPENFGAEKETP